MHKLGESNTRFANPCGQNSICGLRRHLMNLLGRIKVWTKKVLCPILRYRLLRQIISLVSFLANESKILLLDYLSFKKKLSLWEERKKDDNENHTIVSPPKSTWRRSKVNKIKFCNQLQNSVLEIIQMHLHLQVFSLLEPSNGAYTKRKINIFSERTTRLWKA